MAFHARPYFSMTHNGTAEYSTGINAPIMGHLCPRKNVPLMGHFCTSDASASTSMLVVSINVVYVFVTLRGGSQKLELSHVGVATNIAMQKRCPRALALARTRFTRSRLGQRTCAFLLHCVLVLTH